MEEAPKTTPTGPVGYAPSAAPLAVKPKNPYVISVISLFTPGGTFAIPALLNAAVIDEAVEDGKFARASAKSAASIRWLIACWAANLLFLLMMILAVLAGAWDMTY